MAKGKFKSSINSSKAISLLGEGRAGVATSLWGIFSEFDNQPDSSDALHAKEQLNTSSLHSSFVPIFTNMSKKDGLTRMKGLVTFKEQLSLLIENPDPELEWEPVLSNFTYIYIRVGVYDSDVKIRRLSNECLSLLHKIVGGKRLEKFCKLFFPALWLSCNDLKPDVSKSALECLEGLVKGDNKEKMIKLINFCSEPMFGLFGRLLSCNIKSIKNELNANVSSLSEEEELFDRIISISIASVRRVMETLQGGSDNLTFLRIALHLVFTSLPPDVERFLQDSKDNFKWSTLQMGTLWKFISSNYSSVVRVDAVILLTYSMSIIQNQFKLLSPQVVDTFYDYIPSASKSFVDSLKCLSDASNSNVQAVSPKLISILSRLFPKIWHQGPCKLFDSPIKYFTKTLLMCLRNPNQISCRSLFSELPYIVASIPFQVLLAEFSNLDNEISLINEIIKKTDFYFKAFNELMVFLDESIKSNNLPLLCLIPLGIISHFVKFSTNSSNDSTKILLGTPNSTLLNCSLEAYYTILLHFLHNKFTNFDQDQSQLREFLLNYYSKMIWTPIIFSITIDKAASGSIVSSGHSKAQFKINEQFSNMMIDSIQIHSWSIEQCKERRLDNCISNLNDFLTGYWTRFYMDQLNKHQSHKPGYLDTQNSYKLIIFLELCSILNKHDSEFIDNVLLWLKNTSYETFLCIDLLDGSDRTSCEYKTVVSKLKLINKAITYVIIKPIYEQEHEKNQQITDLFLQIFSDFVQIVLKVPQYGTNYSKVHTTYHVLEDIFLPLILTSSHKELGNSPILERMIFIVRGNPELLTSITIESFLYKLLTAKEPSLSQVLLEVVCKDSPQVSADILDRVSSIFTSARKYESQMNCMHNHSGPSSLATGRKSSCLDFKECYIHFFVALSKTSLVNESKSFSDFLKGFIMLLLKPALANKSISRLNLGEMSHLRALLTNFMNNVGVGSEEFVSELLSLLIYSENDAWFKEPNSKDVIIPIVDSIFSKSQQVINSRYRDEIFMLEKSLLFEAFNIRKEKSTSKEMSIQKLALLVDRSSDGKLATPGSCLEESHENVSSFERLAGIMARLSNLLVDQNSIIEKNLFETGFKIRRFLRIYKEVTNLAVPEQSSDSFGDFASNSNINVWLVLYTVKHLFVSEESIKLLVNSRELTLDKEMVLPLFNASEFMQESKQVGSLIRQFSQYLTSKHIQSKSDFQQAINSIRFILDDYSRPESRFMMTLESNFFVYLFDLLSDHQDMRNKYLAVIIDHLNSNTLESGSVPLFLALMEMKSKGVSLPETYNDLSGKLLYNFEVEMKERSKPKRQDYSKLSRLVVCSKSIIVQEGVHDYNIEASLDHVTTWIEDLAEELSNFNICAELNASDLYILCNFLAVLIELLQEYLKIYIKDREIQDNIEVEFQHGKLEISKLMIKLSSTIHYLVGKIFEVSISESDSSNIAERLDDYSLTIQHVVLNSLKLSCIIYQKLCLSSDKEGVPDELRFTSITIQLETNILNTFDKFLGLFSTALISRKSTAVSIGLRAFLEQIMLLRDSENMGKMWILSVLESKLGSIKGNAMEISKLLTTNSLKLHSFVLLILKEHNWYNTQYEYSDLNSAIASIEKLDGFIREYLIMKNEDDDLDDIDEYQDPEDYQPESVQEPTNPTASDSEGLRESQGQLLASDSENFERGIEVIASHWRRLIGPSLAQQLLETYFSAINIAYHEEIENEVPTKMSKSLNSTYIDVSQRLGCWNFILPKLISEDFVICMDKENPNIKTIEKNLTPCIESLLELKPIVIGEAIKEKQINPKSHVKNNLLPSRLEDEDTSICQALQYFVKGRSFSELIQDEMVLRNTTFSGLKDILNAPRVAQITQKTIKLSLIHVLVEVAFQTLVILEDRIRHEEANQSTGSCSDKVINSQTNWFALFKHSSNAERRKLLTANLEEILQLDPNSSSEKMVWDSGNIFFTWLLATRIILSLTTYFPRILREIWLCNSNNKTQIILQKLVINYFSPTIIPIEFSHIPLIVEKMSNPDRKIIFDHNISSRTIKISYSERGFTATLSFTFSQQYPLIIPKVNIPNVVGISKKQNSNWLISVIKAVRYKNVTHAILTWVNNLSLYLDGIEDCLICYSIVHPQYRSLPRKRCNTCNNIFHSECIYKWFRTSNKVTCPLCISIMH